MRTKSVPGAAAAAAAAAPLMRTDLPLPHRRQGKVRDVYRVPAAGGSPPRVLIVATDRISAFDVVLPTPVPGKGRLLSEISVKWFQFIRSLGVIADHLLSTDPADLPVLGPAQRAALAGRIMIGRAAEVVPVEFVVRGYLAGSGWKEYERAGSVCGVKLPAGLRRADKLPEPIFTPTTKAREGHDEPLTYDQACDLAGRKVMDRLCEASLAIYRAGSEYAAGRGTILADTKFEFGWALDARGRPTRDLLLIDEVLTPDSSRYWPADRWQPGREQESFDKQYVRDYLQGLCDAGRWDKSPPGPELPPDVVANTLKRYVEVRDRLFG